MNGKYVNLYNEKGVVEGRPVGVKESTQDDKVHRVARLALEGLRPGMIGQLLGMTTTQATTLVKQARALGLIDVLRERENVVVVEMAMKRAEVARQAFDVVQMRLAAVKGKQPEKINARDVKDAFSALDVTEWGKKEVERDVGKNPPNMNVSIFTTEQVQEAGRVSDAILIDGS